MLARTDRNNESDRIPRNHKHTEFSRIPAWSNPNLCPTPSRAPSFRDLPQP